MNRPTSFVDYGTNDSYRGEVERSVDFMPGVKHDLFIKAKAEALLALVARRLGETSSLSLLDVGCGVGSMQRYVLPHVGKSSGVDTEASAVEEAKRTFGEALSASHYDGHTLPFADNTFDVSFTVNVMHHVPPPARERFMAEMLRVTRPGGLAVVFEHNPLNPLTRLAVFRCAFDDDAILLHPREVRRRLTKAGGEIAEQRYILFFPIDQQRARDIEQHLRWLPMGAQYVVAARKPA